MVAESMKQRISPYLYSFPNQTVKMKSIISVLLVVFLIGAGMANCLHDAGIGESV